MRYTKFFTKDLSVTKHGFGNYMDFLNESLRGYLPLKSYTSYHKYLNVAHLNPCRYLDELLKWGLGFTEQFIRSHSPIIS